MSVFPQTTETLTSKAPLWHLIALLKNVVHGLEFLRHHILATYSSECFAINVLHLPISTGCGDNQVSHTGKRSCTQSQGSWSELYLQSCNAEEKKAEAKPEDKHEPVTSCTTKPGEQTKGKTQQYIMLKKQNTQKTQKGLWVSNCNIPNSRWSQWTCNLQRVHNMDL